MYFRFESVVVAQNVDKFLQLKGVWLIAFFL